MGLVVDEVTVSGAAAHIDVKPFALKLANPGQFEAHVAALDLAAFLDSKAPGGLKDFALAIRDGNIYVEATARVIVEVRAKVACTLRIQEGTKIYIDLVSVDVVFPGAKNMVQSQLDQINPILDASTFPLNVTFQDVSADHDRIVLKGTAAP